MLKAQLIITAVVLEGSSKSEVARDYNVSRYWVQQLVKRYKTEGAAAFEPHSRRPHHNPHTVSAPVQDKIVRLRKTLNKAGYDAGAATIAEHLAHDHTITNVPAVSTIWRVLSRRRFVVPQPHKRPRSRRHLLAAFSAWGTPAGVLTDNGAIFTAKQRGDRRTAMEITPGQLGIKIEPLAPPTTRRPAARSNASTKH